jgi:5-methylthioadenosine/S-adenosylhomocysteine deaminase
VAACCNPRHTKPGYHGGLLIFGCRPCDRKRSSNANYAHCPTIYPRRGRYPQFEKIIAKGIKTGFATDWMLNDPFEGMRYAINAMRLRLGGPHAMTCDQALRFHTLGAAQVLGLAHEIGSLEVGKKADLIVVDINQPHLQPYYGSYAAFV